MRPFLDTIQHDHLYQHIFEPTRYRNEDTPGLLGLVFTNGEGMIKYLTHNAGLSDSDHECINFSLTCYEEGTGYDKNNKLLQSRLYNDKRKAWPGKLGIATLREFSHCIR